LVTAPVGTNQYTKQDGDNVTNQPKRGNDLAYTLDPPTNPQIDLTLAVRNRKTPEENPGPWKVYKRRRELMRDTSGLTLADCTK
jgi:hypothetical protein